MRVIQTHAELAEALSDRPRARPAFVPTMGALHMGHVALIKRAVELAQANRNPPALVVVSIFVNPTQFGPNEDYTRYPRTLDADVAAANAAGADIVFAPSVGEVYPSKGANDFLRMNLPDEATRPRLEDAHRPTHFAGVCQVVARLFDFVQPASAIFGEKDYQQLLVIKAMVEAQRNRWPGLEIIAHPTVREADGLAMSSRNAYLDDKQRQSALGLSRALKLANDLGINRAESAMREVLRLHNLAIDYAVVRDGETLMPVVSGERPLRALIAARVGNVRLIDSATVRP